MGWLRVKASDGGRRSNAGPPSRISERYIVIGEHGGYEENIYGESSSPLHQGSPTERFVAEWHLRAPHVERRIRAGGALVRDASIGAAPIVNPSKPGAWLEPVEGELAHESRRVLVEVPIGFSDMQREAPGLALQWRLTTRRIFQSYFSRGYRAVDFFLSRAARRGQYLLAQR